MKTKLASDAVQSEQLNSPAAARVTQVRPQSRFKRMLFSISLESEWSKFALVMIVLIFVWLMNTLFSGSN